jgi:TetR/AcrR family transcriptional regulator, transcriptional repressor for nem operon
MVDGRVEKDIRIATRQPNPIMGGVLDNTSYGYHIMFVRRATREVARCPWLGKLPMSAKAEQKQNSHETILESAARLVRERGIAGARVADVMEGAGLTVGGFYAHFSSKEELVDEALRRTGVEVRSNLFSRLEEKPAAHRAVVVLKRYLSAAHRDEQTLRCPLPAVVGEVGTKAREHRGVIEEGVSGLVKEMEALLPKTAQPSQRRVWALGLVALMYGGLGLARALKGTKLSDEVLSACRTFGITVLRGWAKQDDEGEEA